MDRRRKPNRYALIMKRGFCRFPYLVEVTGKQLEDLKRREIKRTARK